MRGKVINNKESGLDFDYQYLPLSKGGFERSLCQQRNVINMWKFIGGAIVVIVAGAILSLVVVKSLYQQAAPVSPLVSPLPEAIGPESPPIILLGDSPETLPSDFTGSLDTAASSEAQTGQSARSNGGDATTATGNSTSLPVSSTAASNIADPAATGTAGQPDSPGVYKYINIDLEKCRKVSPDDDWEIIQQCYYGYNVTILVTAHMPEPRSWVDIGINGAVYSTEDIIVYDQQNLFGHFPQVSGQATLIVDEKLNKPVSLVFPVEAQDAAATHLMRQYFAVDLRLGEQPPCFIARSASLEEAMRALQRSTTCRSLGNKRIIK